MAPVMHDGRLRCDPPVNHAAAAGAALKRLISPTLLAGQQTAVAGVSAAAAGANATIPIFAGS